MYYHYTKGLCVKIASSTITKEVAFGEFFLILQIKITMIDSKKLDYPKMPSKVGLKISIISALVFLGFSACTQPAKPKLEIPEIYSNKNIVIGARSQIGVVTKYDTSYYSTAYPPADTGVCADVIWRAFQETGYDFKKMLDEDIRKNSSAYPQNSLTDENINFRRVQNIRTYLERHAQSLTTEVKPGDKTNLSEWQGGDIVTFAQIKGGLWHIAIISNKRQVDGIPLLIHNYGRGVKEDNFLTNWPTKITGHFRMK